MPLLVCLLGQPKISRGETLIHLPGYKPLALLAYLMVTGKTHSREHLVDLLYDESADPRASLRWTLSHLRQTIGGEYIQADRQQIAFKSDSDHWLDVAQLLTGDTDVYRGDFLEGLYIRDGQGFMDWAFFERERYRRLYQAALAQQLQTHEAQGNYEKVIEIGHKLIHLDNLREEWHQALMRAYAQLGQRETALAQYETCRVLLEQELGITPGEETIALCNLIRRGKLATARLPTMDLVDGSPQYPAFLKVDEAAESERRPIFVARERELERLNQFLKQAISSNAQVVFVAGEAGRGKTALVTEFAWRAQETHPDLLVALGNCNTYSDIGDPYLPFRDLMSMLTGDVEAHLAAGTIGHGHARRLWATLPATVDVVVNHGVDLIDRLISSRELLSRLQGVASGDTQLIRRLQNLSAREQARASDLAQHHLFQQFTNVLRALAAQKPLLLLLDDLQWTDATSLSLLFHLGRRLAGSPILLIGTYRPEEISLERAGERHPLQKVLAEFKRAFGDIWVDLDQADVVENQRFVNAYLNSEPNQLGETFRQGLYQRTEGHPLFTVELLRMLQERGDLRRNETGQWIEGPSLNWEQLPARIEAVIEERIDRLPEELQQVLAVASVEGEVFTGQVVARVRAMEERRLLHRLSQVLSRKHRLVCDQGEVNSNGQILSRYQFTNALFQHFLYNRLDPGERRLLHQAVGEALERLYRDETEGIAGQLAWHFQEARYLGKAVAYLQVAGEQAAGQYANDEAIGYFSRALELTPTGDHVQHYALLLAREKVYDVQGARKAQKQDLIALTKLTEILNDDYKRTEVALRQASYAKETGNYQAAISIAQTAVALSRKCRVKPFVAEGYYRWGSALFYHSKYEAAKRKLNQALALARKIELPMIEAGSLNLLGGIAHRQDDDTAAKAYVERALHLYRRTGDRLGEVRLLNNLGIISLAQGEYAKAVAYSEQSLQLSREIGDRPTETSALTNLGVQYLDLGQYARASTYFEQALAASQETGERLRESGIRANLGQLHYLLGDYQNARKWCDQALAISQELGERDIQAGVLTELGHIVTGLENVAEAIDLYRQSLVMRQELGQHLAAMETRAGLARACMAQGNLLEARAQVEEILRHLKGRTLYEGISYNIFQIYVTCYQVLEAVEDLRAESILKSAHNLLTGTAAKIEDEGLRQSFLQNVATNRKIVREFNSLHGGAEN